MASSTSTRLRLLTPFVSTPKRSSCSQKGTKLRLLQLGATARDTVVLIDCFQLDKGDWADLRQFFRSPNRFWLAHNAVFDLGWLQEHNIYPTGWIRCSMLASRLLTNGLPKAKHGLANVVKRYLKDVNGKPKELSKEQQTRLEH